MTVEMLERRPVRVDPGRDLHGPCVVRATNGDWLLCHQDSDEHHGGDGYVHQWRSRDRGATWQDEGAVADWRDRDLDALFGEYGAADDGRLVMFVQRREPRSGNEGIQASWYSVSEDHGRTWQERGPVDDGDEYAAVSARNVVGRDGVLYAGAWSRHGHALYVSDDCCDTWQRRSVVFPPDYPGFQGLRPSGPPYYPHVVWCPDGSLLAACYVTPDTNHCFLRRSADAGRTWAEIESRPDLAVWAPRLKRLDDDTLILTGRDVTCRATVLCASPDSGRTWSAPAVLDQPAFEGSYAYTDSLPLTDGECWVFTSSPQSPGRGDILGLRVRVDAPRA